MTWGVSIPIWRHGPSITDHAAASRSEKDSPRWATTSNPSGNQSPGSPSSARTLRSAPRDHDVERVGQGGRRQRRGLVRVARRAQPGLHPARNRSLGHHEETRSRRHGSEPTHAPPERERQTANGSRNNHRCLTGRETSIRSPHGSGCIGDSEHVPEERDTTFDRPEATRVLVVDDDSALAEVVARYLEREGFHVDLATDGATGLAFALETLPDLVVLDLMLPVLDGLEVCRRLRQAAPIPVVMLTARGEEDDRIAGLELGADDYVTKPFSPRELTARVKAVLRRAKGGISDNGVQVLRGGGVEVDLVAHEVERDGQPVALTSKEFDLLVHFLANPRRAFRREELLESVWGWTFGDTATVTVHVRRLREKLEDDPSDPRHLVTVRGTGYRFEP